MKKISIYLFLLASISTIGQTMTSGFIKYKMTSNNEQMAMMGDVFMTNYFDANNVAIEIDMMSGMVVTKVFKNNKAPQDLKMTMNAMGQKYEVTGIDEKSSKGTDISDLENIVTVDVDKKTTKEIAGFKCYKAKVSYKDGKTGEFYITENIKIATTVKDSKLNGFPLEMKIVTPQGTVELNATEVSKELPKNAFIVPEGYEKVTMEEFQQRMGG